MLQSVIDSSMTQEEKCIVIWKLVALSGLPYEFDYNSDLKDNVNPLALFRFRHFMCGEKAGILANLINAACINARTVNMDGHVVSEAYYDSAWHMFDADMNCIFRNKSGDIASVEDLKNNPEWLNEEQVEFLNNDNFVGFGKYYKFLKNYDNSWADINSILTDFEPSSNAIKLYPQDRVSFQLHPTGWWKRFLSKRYLYDAKGVLTSRIKRTNKNLHIVKNGNTLYSRELPYYITQIRIYSDAPVNAKVFFIYESRETGERKKESLGTLTELNPVIISTKAPTTNQIFYKYSLLFENLSLSLIDNITIEQSFDFNPVTFPLHRRGGKIIHTEGTITPPNLSYFVSK